MMTHNWRTITLQLMWASFIGLIALLGCTRVQNYVPISGGSIVTIRSGGVDEDALQQENNRFRIRMAGALSQNGVPSILIDGVGNMASNAVARSMGFSSQSDGSAFASGLFKGALRVGIRTISAKFSGAEFQRSKHNTVAEAHRGTDIYKDLMNDPKGNAFALAYRGNNSKFDPETLDLVKTQEGSWASNMLNPTFNNLSQVHDGWNGLMHAAGNHIWLENKLLNYGTMLPSGIIAQHLDQGSFWDNYGTYR